MQKLETLQGIWVFENNEDPDPSLMSFLPFLTNEDVWSPYELFDPCSWRQDDDEDDDEDDDDDMDDEEDEVPDELPDRVPSELPGGDPRRSGIFF